MDKLTFSDYNYCTSNLTHHSSAYFIGRFNLISDELLAGEVHTYEVNPVYLHSFSHMPLLLWNLPLFCLLCFRYSSPCVHQSISFPTKSYSWNHKLPLPLHICPLKATGKLPLSVQPLGCRSQGGAGAALPSQPPAVFLCQGNPHPFTLHWPFHRGKQAQAGIQEDHNPGQQTVNNPCFCRHFE